MSHRRPAWTLLAAVLAIGLVAACNPGDPHARALKERSKWTVQPPKWAATPQNVIHVSTRLSGPPNSKIKTLTVRFVLQDAEQNELADHWYTYDLSQLPRGGPKDINVSIPAGDLAVESLGLDLMLQPTEEQAARIPELQS